MAVYKEKEVNYRHGYKINYHGLEDELDAPDEKFQMDGGSTRSGHASRYDLVPIEGLTRIADRFEQGNEIHGPDNWKKSIIGTSESSQAFLNEAFNHMLEHAFKYQQGDRSDNHLGAIGWYVCMAAWAEEHWTKRDKRAVEGLEETFNKE
jgi:hypothetical protein